MSAVTVHEMRAAEEKALLHGWSEESLLDLAGNNLGHAIARRFSKPGFAVAYLGKGHNAGDALVALKVLRDHYGWDVAARCALPTAQMAAITRRKWDELALPSPMEGKPSHTRVDRPLVLLDGLLGIGATGAVRPPLLELAQEMEELRQTSHAQVLAVDLPSGLDADTGTPGAGCVVADVTFTIGNAKTGLLTGQAANHAGCLVLVPVAPLTSAGTGDLAMISPQTMPFGKLPRPFDFHKGMAGHVAVFAGSPSYTGAAVLCALGALRGGAGLVSLYVPPHIHGIVAAKCPPEVIVHPLAANEPLHGKPADAWVIGCGLGPYSDAGMRQILELLESRSAIPTVVDADALNWLAGQQQLHVLKNHHVLTPHPGEFRRLAPDLAPMPRETAAREFVKRHKATLLLKGCRTLIAHRDIPVWSNSTGNPGMASAGMGDLLAGVIGARLADGNPTCESAAQAAWLCGRAAELAMQNGGCSEESLLASDVAAHLGAAFEDWKNGSR